MASLVVSVARRGAASRRLAVACTARNSRRGFSSTPRSVSSTEGEKNEAAATPTSTQAFVKTRLEAGEWDEERTDPLYRPKFKSSARIIAADDFANRPTVGFHGEFESFQDAMVTLTYLDSEKQKEIYKLYTGLMLSSEKEYGKTSHEYVMRVCAQKFNITPERAAAAVQLQHNEEQILLNEPDRPLLTAAAASIERKIKQEIKQAYETFNLQQPSDMFIEDPVGVDGDQESKKYVTAEDVLDVDKMKEDAIVRDEKKARVMIDGHVYIEDVDEDTIDVPSDRDCKSLLSQHERLAKQLEAARETVRQQRARNKAAAPKFREKNAEGEKRPRWKYIAQTVNTRELKRKKKKHRSYINNSPENTLVEHDGELRVANMEEIKTVSWKPIRHEQEHVYQWVKKGWLDRTNRGQRKAWGFGPPRVEKKQSEEETKAADEKAAASESASEADGDKKEASAETSDASGEKASVVDNEKRKKDKDEEKKSAPKSDK